MHELRQHQRLFVRVFLEVVRVVVMMMALNRPSFTADASNLLVTSKAADNPVEERPFKGRV